MIELEINGIPVRARSGTMIIEAAEEAGFMIPRFCFHKKLSIAANCRMCLVEIDKAPKPMPACSIPTTDGMKIFTNSPKAIMAQKGVMEFLLINHPLDCPICDQGGECELQDVAMGYGRNISRYQEKKRVIKDKNLGPLIASDMTRCIHCTRCVRFGEEIAGLMELGATGRGEHMEIGTYVEKGMTSEMSGNVIDLCPVGALTSKPFRFTARAWEMTQHESIAPHDSVGSNINLHVRDGRVLRVVPRENEQINEVWISDRDRFSYQGLNSADRLHAPQIKQDGVWREVDWPTALDATVAGLRKTIADHGVAQVGTLMSPSSTLEEMYLLQKLMRGLGCENIDHRLRQTDFRVETQAPGLGQSIESLQVLDAALLIGSNLRLEQPILGHRLRKAAMLEASVMLINPVDYEFNFPVSEKIIGSPAAMLHAAAGVAKALLGSGGILLRHALKPVLEEVEVDETHLTMAKHLKNADNGIVLLGNISEAHPHYSTLYSLARLIAELSGASLGVLPAGANSVGAWLAGALPHRAAADQTVDKPGLDSSAMLNEGLQAYVLMGLEPEFDCANPAAALKSLHASSFVVSLSAYRSALLDSYADVMLPIAAFAETSGTYLNVESCWQSFDAAVAPQGEAKPGWKVMRVLGNLLNLPGFDYISSEQVRDELRGLSETGSPEEPVTVASDGDAKREQAPALHGTAVVADDDSYSVPIVSEAGLMRITDVPPYAIDALVRHADALQQTPAARPAAIYINASLASQLGLANDDLVLADQAGAQARLPVVIDSRIPDGCVLIPAGLPRTTTLGASFGSIALSKSSIDTSKP